MSSKEANISKNHINCSLRAYLRFERDHTQNGAHPHQIKWEIQKRGISQFLKEKSALNFVFEDVSRKSYLINSLEPEFLDNFMGFNDRKVPYLGHGIGLEIAENPVIAKGFNEPLEEDMVIALEPKKGIAGIGMVGTENTFRVTRAGGKSLTGNHPGLLKIQG